MHKLSKIWYTKSYVTELCNSKDLESIANIGFEMLDSGDYDSEALELVVYTLQQNGYTSDASKISIAAATKYCKSWFFNFIAGSTLLELKKYKDSSSYLKIALDLSKVDSQTLKLYVTSIARSESIFAAKRLFEWYSSISNSACNTVVAQIENVFDFSRKVNAKFQYIYDSEVLYFKEPTDCFNPENSYVLSESTKPYICEIRDARIFFNSSLILVQNNIVLSDTAGHKEYGKYVGLNYEKQVLARDNDSILINLNGFNTNYIDSCIYIGGLASNAFGHWIPDYLPRINFLRLHPDFKDLPILVDSCMPASHYEHLKRLVDNKIVLIERDESYICNKILYAPSPTFFPVEMLEHNIERKYLNGLSPRALQFLIQKRVPSEVRNKRVFLSRRKTSWRYIVNEKELIDSLIPYGFDVVFLEDLSVNEQIDIFENAEAIIAPNGSSLLNIIFASKDVKLVILSQGSFYDWGSYNGAVASLGYKPVWVCGEPTVKNSKHSNYAVPLDKLMSVIHELGINRVSVDE